MNDKKFYLKYNVQLEPLINQWYAWPYLIAPGAAAMNIANSHLKIMKSYVMTPQVHAAAVKNPAMRGGPFIDYDGKRVDEIKALMEKTAQKCAPLLKFAEGIKELNELLASEAKGHSLEPLYERVPEALKGYVELVYDLNHRPSVRLIERLLYSSSFYDPSLQSVSLSLVNSDERAFVFSTPRLEDEGQLHLHIPFNHPGLDDLFRMRDVPQTFEYIKERLGVEDKDDALLLSFLTEEPATRPPRYEGTQTRVRYFGHACVLMESNGVSVMIDPVISYDYENSFARYSYKDLPDTLDYVLITHSHADHIMFETLLQLRYKIKTIIVPRNNGGSLEDPSLKLVLQSAGFKNVVEIDEMETIEVAGGSITALPFLGEHADLNIRSKAAHLVRFGEKSIVCAADSSNIEPKLYEHIHRLVGNIDILFLGMECDGAPLTWIYGPLITTLVDRKMDRSRRLSGSDFERGMAIIETLKCKQVYIYAMGQEPWLCYLTSIVYTDESKPIVESNKLLEACAMRNIVSERLYGTKELLV